MKDEQQLTQQQGKTRFREMRIRGISSKTQREIKNVARYHGVSVSDFFKPLILKLMQDFPDHMKADRPTYD